ncbi:MAG TPA: hypothetical protein VII38_04175 [Polyangia bacterium]
MLALLLCALTLTGAAARAASPESSFITVRDGRFYAGEKPFAFVGANLQVMQGERERAHYRQTLDAAASDGLTVGRIWALGEGPPDAPAWQRAFVLFRAGPDDFLDDADLQLDRVLAHARARGVRLILTLANYWPDYGGVDAYLRWAGLPTGSGGAWGARDRFFTDARVQALYRAHVARLLNRVNTVTGVRYADDPTIFAWELMNESQVDSPGESGQGARLAWISEMARFIRARDPHHLITPGVAIYTTRKERSEWLAACRLPEVDYCDAHLYPEGTDLVSSLGELYRFIDDRVQLARFVAKKPIVFGELGFDTRAASWLGRPRAAWFSDFLRRVFYDGGAGALVWIYQPWTGHARDYGIYTDRSVTDDVRASLRRAADQLAAIFPTGKNPRLGPARGARILYDPYKVLHRSERPQVVRRGAQTIVELDPTRFFTGRFERVGSWTAGPLAHAYGSGDGYFEWRFSGRPARSLELRARLSSEFPGTHAPPDGGSHVEVAIDGRPVGALDVIPDDGAGRVESLAITDRALLYRLRSGEHTLRLSVAPGPRANGVCVYGAPTGHGPTPPGETLPVELVFTSQRR